MSRLNLFLGSLAVSIVSFGASSSALATTLDDSITTHTGTFSNFIASADNRSFDGTGTSPMGAFDGFVTAGEYLEFGLFDVATSFEVEFLFELTAYADFNEFGVIDDTGGFTSLTLGSDVAGSTRTVDIAAGNNRLGLRSPDGTFSSIDAENAGGLSYIIGQRILEDGTVKLFGNEFTVTAGQFVVFFEDLAGAFPTSDQDYNDGVLLLSARSAEVPEPATLSLLLAGLGGLGFRRKKA